MNELEAARRAAVLVASAHVGGCPACAQSVAALAAPRYASRLRAQGVVLTPAPRQADILLLCGTLNERSREAALGLLDQTPRPRALVAVGDCALNGCVFAGGPALTSQPLAETLGVNVEIGGCPPSPEMILDAIAEAQRLLSGEEEKGASEEPGVDEQPRADEGPEAPEAAPAAGAPGGYELDDLDGEAEAAGDREERR
jgi:Ni,Fe-hydrogenase III small subunit